MHILFLGYSSIVRRRALPAAGSVPAIRRISVASRSHGSAGAGPGVPGVGWFADYEEALASSGADLVYVSGANATHTQWVLRALEHGRHVIVDKPAFPDLDTARNAVELARSHGLGLAEATVFASHPQADALRELIAGAQAGALRATATFSFPPLPPQDFRYRAASGGGSLYDLGPYAAATNRLLFGTAPAGVHCAVLTRDRDVDTSFSILLTHEHGGSLTGHFGFVTAYQNRLSVLTPSRSIEMERLFTTPPDMDCTVRVRGKDNTEHEVPVPAADAFARFIQAFTGAAARRDFGAFEQNLLEDAALVTRLRRAAGLVNAI